MSPKPDASQARIPQILEAALNVFSKRGLTKTRMDDVAGEAGLSKGTLYNYFPSKDALIEGIMTHMLAREMKQAEELIGEEGAAAEKLLRFTEIMAGDILAIKPFLSLYLEFIALSMRRKGIRKLIRHYFAGFLDLLEALLQQGIESGEFRPVDVRATALALGAIFEGSILLWVYDPDVLDLNTHIRSGIQLVLNGILASN